MEQENKTDTKKIVFGCGKSALLILLQDTHLMVVPVMMSHRYHHPKSNKIAISSSKNAFSTPKSRFLNEMNKINVFFYTGLLYTSFPHNSLWNLTRVVIDIAITHVETAMIATPSDWTLLSSSTLYNNIPKNNAHSPTYTVVMNFMNVSS